MAEITPAALNSLAAKLDGLDLSDDERRLLDELLARAEAYEPEVEGFGLSYGGLQSGADLSSPTAFSLGGALGFTTGPFVRGYGDPTDPNDPGGPITKPPPP